MDNSHKTAIKRNKLSAPMAYLKRKGLLKGRVLDYGCGRGDDVDRLKKGKLDGRHYDRYDPHYYPIYPTGMQYDTITCNYVLNTIESHDVRTGVIVNILNLLKKGGTAYITVRRDRFKEGRTSKGTWQGHIKLSFPVLYEKKGSYVIYKLASYFK